MLLEDYFPHKLQYIFHNCVMKITLSLADTFTDDLPPWVSGVKKNCLQLPQHDPINVFWCSCGPEQILTLTFLPLIPDMNQNNLRGFFVVVVGFGSAQEEKTCQQACAKHTPNLPLSSHPGDFAVSTVPVAIEAAAATARVKRERKHVHTGGNSSSVTDWLSPTARGAAKIGHHTLKWIISAFFFWGLEFRE